MPDKTQSRWPYGIPWGQLDRLVDWRLTAPSVARKYNVGANDYTTEERLKEGILQKTFCLEVRVDFKDKERFDTARVLFQTMALHLVSNMDLLADHGVKTQTVVFEDDWFAGKKEIDLLPDTIQQGKDELAKFQKITGHSLTMPGAAVDDGPSEDMIEALREQAGEDRIDDNAV